MEVKDILLKEIKIASNYRVDYEDMPNLMNSIKAWGLLQPIGVKAEEKGYSIIWGHRRLKAFEKLGYKMIPSVIFRETDEEMSEEDYSILQVNENYQHKATNLQELGRAVKLLKKTMSDSEIAAKFGMSKTRIKAAFDEIQRVPIKWQKRIRYMAGTEDKKGDISMGTSLKISSLRGLNPKQRDELYELASKKGDDFRGTEIAVLGSLMAKGQDINKAIKEIEKYKAVDMKFFVDRVKWEELLTRTGTTGKDFVIQLLNKNIPNLAMKNIDKYS